MNKLPISIREKLDVKLHLQKGHPICWIKDKIISLFKEFHIFDNLDCRVSVSSNFDELLIPADHPSRSKSDTFYIDDFTLLRTHTSAHQNEILKKGIDSFIVVGDVYRKDEIDKSHYPIFHQLEGVSVCKDLDPTKDLHEKMENMISSIMPNSKFRKVESYFPFTTPSWEYEVFWKDNWLEVAGCGLIHPDILRNCNVKSPAWAFGVGLDRLVMSLFDIPDIRYLWSKDDRFLDQFKNIKSDTIFKEFSFQPPCIKDVAFWSNENFTEGDFFQLIREIGKDLIENVKKIDEFANKDRISYCYRIQYRAMDKTLTNEEINSIQDQIRKEMVAKFQVILR